MAGDNGILESGQAVSTRISEFAAKLSSIHDELSGRIDSIAAGSSVWIGPSAPTDIETYSSWIRILDDDTDLLYNLGTQAEPQWTSVLRTTKATAIKGMPFKTGERIGTRVVWAVDVDLGSLPNTTTKMASVPSEVTSVWGPVGERWLDLSNCFAYEVGSGTTLPLPYSLIVESEPDVPTWERGVVYLEDDYVIYQGRAYQAKWYTNNDRPDQKSGQSDVWIDLGPVETADIPMRRGTNDTSELFLKNSFVHVRTATNRTGFRGVARIKYLKAI